MELILPPDLKPYALTPQALPSKSHMPIALAATSDLAFETTRLAFEMKFKFEMKDE